MATAYGPAKAGVNQIRSPVRRPIVYTPSTSSDMLKQGERNNQRSQAFKDWGTNALPYRTRGVLPTQPAYVPASFIPPSWHTYYETRPLSPAAPPISASAMPSFEDQSYPPGAHLGSSVSHSPYYDAAPKDLSNMSARSVVLTNRSFDLTVPTTNEMRHDANTFEHKVHQQDTENDGQIGWDVPTNSTLDPPHTVEADVSTKDDSIVLNGVKYVKVENVPRNGRANVDLRSQHPVSGLFNSDFKSVNAPSETYEEEEASYGDSDVHDEAASQRNEYSYDSRHATEVQEEMPINEDNLCSRAQTTDSEKQNVEDGEHWSNDPVEGTLDNPIKVPGFSDEELVHVLVGNSVIHEYKILKSIMKTLLLQARLDEPLSALYTNQSILLQGIEKHVFQEMIACMYAGHANSRGSEVFHGCLHHNFGALYQAAKFFGFHDLAREALTIFGDRSVLVGVFDLAREVYATEQVDDKFRSFIQRQIARHLDEMGTPEDDSDDYVHLPVIESVITDSSSPALLRGDIIKALIDRDLARRVIEEGEAARAWTEVSVNGPSWAHDDAWNIAEASEPTDDQAHGAGTFKTESDGGVSQNKPTCSNGQSRLCYCRLCIDQMEEALAGVAQQGQVEAPIKGRADLCAIAIKDSNDWDCSIKFKKGDRFTYMDLHAAPPRSTIDSNVPTRLLGGVCKGVYGTFPLSYVKLEVIEDTARIARIENNLGCDWRGSAVQTLSS